MIEFFKNMLHNESAISSARFINVAGFFLVTKDGKNYERIV